MDVYQKQIEEIFYEEFTRLVYLKNVPHNGPS